MRLYLAGAEIGSHRTLLQQEGVTNLALSYMGLRRRTKFARPWNLADKFEPGTSIFLDSGAYTINIDEDADPDELVGIFEHYKEFVLTNLDRVDMVSEFDALPLGMDWIEEQRAEFWDTIPREKFMAVWHPVSGIQYLHELAARYEVVGIPATSLEGRNLRPVLNALAAQGTRIHGIAMTKIEEMQSIRWDSVASTSWISPQRFGDTIVWTGKELKRYPKKYKATARKRHRTLFTRMGLDAAAIEADDPTEVLRLSIRSWMAFEEYVNEHGGGGVVTPLFSDREPEKVETPEEPVDKQASEPGKNLSTRSTSTAVEKPRESNTILPVMGLARANEEDEESPTVVHIRSESARVCNTCFLAEKCPMYEPDSNCAYNIPVTIRTREQRKALYEGMIEMQTQRVMFMRFAEEREGGYADPNLTKEMAMLNKMLADFAEMEREGFEVSMRVKGTVQDSAGAGMMSRLFGRDVGQKVQELPQGPVSADEIIDVDILHEEQE